MAFLSANEQLEFEIVIGDMIAEHNMTAKQIELFRDTATDIIDKVCDESLEILED